MLPSGHLAGGALLGAWWSRRSASHPAYIIAGGMLTASAPDLDLLIPTALDRLGIEHGLNTGVHHRWVTHTPLFWALTVTGVRRLARRRGAPEWAPGAADMLAVGVGLHLLQDAVANTVSLLWPLRRREYGLGLDRLAGVDDHLEYIRRYPSSPAGKLEAGLLMAAIGSCVWRLARHGNRSGGSSLRSCPSPPS